MRWHKVWLFIRWLIKIRTVWWVWKGINHSVSWMVICFLMEWEGNSREQKWVMKRAEADGRREVRVPKGSCKGNKERTDWLEPMAKPLNVNVKHMREWWPQGLRRMSSGKSTQRWCMGWMGRWDVRSVSCEEITVKPRWAPLLPPLLVSCVALYLSLFFPRCLQWVSSSGYFPSAHQSLRVSFLSLL